MKIDKRLIKYGTGSPDDVHLGVIPLTEEYNEVPVLSTSQAFAGVKTLTDIAKSPTSEDDLAAMPEQEAVTFAQLNGYTEEIVSGYIHDIASTFTAGDKILLQNVTYHIRQDGDYVGSYTPGSSGNLDDDKKSVAPSKKQVIKYGQVKIVGGTTVLPTGAYFVGLRTIGEDTWAIYYYYVYE